MGRIKDVIEKYGLRDSTNVRGVPGQKMDEECIQAFVEGDPSGTGKYLDWMFFQAGGGKERYDKSVAQWEKGDHGEQPIRDTLRKQYVEEAVAGYKNEKGEYVPPVTEEEAIRKWVEEDEQRFRNYHIHGDEEYTLTGFGFARSWPGNNALYEQIVQAVQRFHRYQAKLKSMEKSTDLSVANYPNLRNLQEALADITFLEIKDHLDHDIVFEDENLLVVCPYNIGSSMKFGHIKWCSANESMFKQAVAGAGPNRWKEYAKDAALYYCRFKRTPSTVANKAEDGPVMQVAILAPHTTTEKAWKFFDTNDTSHSQSEINGMINESIGFKGSKSWKQAMSDVNGHFKSIYKKSRVNLEFVVRK